MATTNPNVPEEGPARRMSLRRARGAGGGGFTSGSSTRTEGEDGFESGESGESEDHDLNAEVRALPAPANPGTDDHAPDDNRRRMAEVAMAGDANYAREYRLSLLHRLLMRNISLDNIARELGVSISTVQKDRVALKARLRETARSLDINELIGERLAFYDEVQATSLRMTSAQNMPNAMKLAAMRTALASSADRTRFLTSAGVFDVLSFRRHEDGSDISDVRMLMENSDRILERLAQGELEESPAPTPTARVKRRTRPGGFKPLDFENGGESGDSEIVDI